MNTMNREMISQDVNNLIDNGVIPYSENINYGS